MMLRFASKRVRMSAKARAAISKAQQARWAKQRWGVKGVNELAHRLRTIHNYLEADR